jgi:hypothetical protein
METFLHKHADLISGVLSCPDRVIFKGHLKLNYPKAVERLLYRHGFLLKDFKRFATQQSEALKEHAMQFARRAGRPYEYLRRYKDKDRYVKKLLEANPVTEGLVCVLATLEASPSFKLKYGKDRPTLEHDKPRCLCLYFYFVDKTFGLIHVRLQTWLPYTVQVYVNGHEWLARKLDAHGIAYTRRENAFTSIQDPQRAQRIANKWSAIAWPSRLSALVRPVNPLLLTLFAGMGYYWVTDQFEYSTDIMFKDASLLKHLYLKLLQHAVLLFSAEDVLTFLGKKLHGCLLGEVITEYKKRWPGARVKHRIKANWIKMYDKFGCVLRIETVINDPYDFKVRRTGKRHGEECTGWFPLTKGVAYLYRYVEIAHAANTRYIEALAVVDDPAATLDERVALARPIRPKTGKSYRGFNPFSSDDIRLFTILMRGEFHLMGFRNKDVRHYLYTPTDTSQERRRQAARISRLFQCLHAHHLIAKIPRSRRWRVTEKGQRLMTTAIQAFNAQQDTSQKEAA